MKSLLLLTALLVPLHLSMAWSAKYAVDCPEHCDNTECRSSLRCKRTVLDDCGCCQVCAAGPGETCYRTVSGMDGVKCGPGLKCHFYSEEDDFGDEFGICKGKEQLLASRCAGLPEGGHLVSLGRCRCVPSSELVREDAWMQVVCLIERKGYLQGGLESSVEESQGLQHPVHCMHSDLRRKVAVVACMPSFSERL